MNLFVQSIFPICFISPTHSEDTNTHLLYEQQTTCETHIGTQTFTSGAFDTFTYSTRQRESWRGLEKLQSVIKHLDIQAPHICCGLTAGLTKSAGNTCTDFNGLEMRNMIHFLFNAWQSRFASLRSSVLGPWGELVTQSGQMDAFGFVKFILKLFHIF